MCGRYQLALPGRTLADLLDAQLAAGDVQPTWNAAPTQVLPILGLASTGRRVLQGAEWGLVPAWARRPGSPLRPLINARAETVAEKPAFRSAVRTGRVLVPVTGFYEWAGSAGSKVPHLIRVRGAAVDVQRGVALDRIAAPGEVAEPFLLAGIAEEWTTPDNVPGLTFTVLTTEPNGLCAPIHDRMPAILSGDDARAWLETPPEATELLLKLLRPFPSEQMEAWPVSRAVNDVRQNGPELGEPVKPGSEADDGELRLL
ncbi:MAG: SOS response-associated peptidase [Gaiellales bacterium]